MFTGDSDLGHMQRVSDRFEEEGWDVYRYASDASTPRIVAIRGRESIDVSPRTGVLFFALNQTCRSEVADRGTTYLVDSFTTPSE